MKPNYYIVRKEEEHGSMWLEDALDLSSAEARVQELTGFWPGEFQVVNQRTDQIVSTASSESDPMKEIERSKTITRED